MTKIKTSDLTDAALDWAAAKCLKLRPIEGMATGWYYGHDKKFEPSTDWSQGGPIIEREKIDLVWQASGDEEWSAYPNSGNDGGVQRGPTPLIAAMRCFVASKLGDEVDVLEELCA